MKLTALNREVARAAGFDAADRDRRKAGRAAWSREDYNRAVREFNRLWPEERDKSGEPYEERRFTTTQISK